MLYPFYDNSDNQAVLDIGGTTLQIQRISHSILAHDEIHRGLKSQTPADVHLLNRRTSAGELCRIVKLLTCLLGEGDKFSNQFDSYPSTRIR